MPKVTLNTVASLQNEATALNTLNDNFDSIDTAIDNTLSRDGSTPNSMGAQLDMNSNAIINLPAAGSNTEPVRRAEYDAAVLAANAGTFIPNGVTNTILSDMPANSFKGRRTTGGDPQDILFSTSILGNLVSAADFGVTGDGLTDDTDAIKDFFHYLASSPYKAGFFSGSIGNIYIVSDTITLGNGITCYLPGTNHEIHAHVNDAVFQNEDESNSRRYNINFLGAGITIDCTSPATYPNSIGFDLRDISSSNIQGIIARNCGIGFQMYSGDTTGCFYNNLYNCVADHCNVGYYIASNNGITTQECTLYSCRVNDCKNIGIQVDTSACKFYSCAIESMGSISTFGTGTGQAIKIDAKAISNSFDGTRIEGAAEGIRKIVGADDNNFDHTYFSSVTDSFVDDGTGYTTFDGWQTFEVVWNPGNLTTLTQDTITVSYPGIAATDSMYVCSSILEDGFMLDVKPQANQYILRIHNVSTGTLNPAPQTILIRRQKRTAV